MWIISKSRLRDFWQKAAHADSQGPLAAWHKHVESVDWKNWADVKASYNTADAVGNCVVFNIGGNKYRLVVRILYPSHKVFILRVMTHRQYDTSDWEKQCGCHAAPPRPYRRRAAQRRVKKKRKEG